MTDEEFRYIAKVKACLRGRSAFITKGLRGYTFKKVEDSKGKNYCTSPTINI